MNAKAKNASERKLFMGGRLDILLWGYQELDSQIDEAITERRQAIKIQFKIVDECPCGCGLKNDICNAHLDAIAKANNDLPF